MKVLTTNLAKTATISSLYETLTYPPSNVVERFLDMPFVSVLDTDTLTIDLGSNKSLDSVFIAGCNATSVSLVIKNAALATLYSATETIDADTVVVYPGSLTARYIEITGTAVGSSYFKIKGVGVGVVFDFGDREYQPDLPVINSTTMTTSATGQVMSNSVQTRRLREISVPVIRKENGFSRLNLIRTTLETIGVGNPVFWDVNDGDSDDEPPIYGVLQREWSISFDRVAYSVTMSIMEAR